MAEVASGADIRYDKENDLFFARLDRAEKAVSIQFDDWLWVKLDADTGKPLEVQILGFANLLKRLAAYARRHGIIGEEAKAVPLEMRYDRDSDDLWIRLQTADPLFPRSIGDDMIAYFSRRTGAVKAVRFPQSSRRGYAVLKKALGALVDEIMAPPKRGKRKRAEGAGSTLGGMLSQVNLDRFKGLAQPHG